MKQISVSTNDPNHATVNLTVRAQIVTALALDQTTVAFRQVPKGQEAVRYLSLTGKYADQSDIVAVKHNNPVLRVEYSKSGYENAPERRIRLTLPADAPIGRFTEQVILETNNPLAPTLKLMVTGEVIGVARAVPYRLVFTLSHRGADVNRQVRVNSESTPFKILGVRCDVPGLLTRLEEVTPGLSYLVTVTLPADFAGEPFNGLLAIETDIPDQKTIEVRVLGQPRRGPTS
mgnify:FL=1